VNASGPRFTPDYGGKAIRYGLAGIKGVGEAVSIAIEKDRKENGPYKGLVDFCIRLLPYGLNKRALEGLVKSGAMDCFTEHHRAKLFNNMEFALKFASTRAKEKASNQMDMFGLLDGGDEASDSGLCDCPPWPATQCFKDERELTGIYLTGHPLGVYKKILPALATLTVEKFDSVPTRADIRAEVAETYPDPEIIEAEVRERSEVPARMVGMLKGVRMIMPKADPNNPKKSMDPWAVLSIDDGTGETEIPCFAKTYAKYRDLLSVMADKPILIAGDASHRLFRDPSKPRREWEEGDVQLVAREIYSLEVAAGSFAKSLHISASYDDPKLEEKIDSINRLMALHQGSVPLMLDLKYSNGTQVVIKCGETGVALTSEFLVDLDKLQRGETYSLETIKDIYLEPPEFKKWNKKKD
jgi:DNA polymerase-3 subunit alpha